jgi:hypothetical protein
MTRQGSAYLVAKSADLIVVASDVIADEARALHLRRRVTTILNGADFDDFAGVEYPRGDRFRITHDGCLFGKRDPQPFSHRACRVEPRRRRRAVRRQLTRRRPRVGRAARARRAARAAPLRTAAGIAEAAARLGRTCATAAKAPQRARDAAAASPTSASNPSASTHSHCVPPGMPRSHRARDAATTAEAATSPRLPAATSASAPIPMSSASGKGARNDTNRSTLDTYCQPGTKAMRARRSGAFRPTRSRTTA